MTVPRLYGTSAAATSLDPAVASMTPPRLGLRRLALATAALLATLPSAATAAPATPVPSGYVTDGYVHATATDAQGRHYIGGEFFSVGKRTGSSWLANPTDGNRVAGFPETDGTINTIEPDGDGGWYVGGAFGTVGDAKVQNVAHVLPDGSVDKTWNPAPNASVNAVVRSGAHVYLGGSFSQVGGKPRAKLTRVSASGVGAPDTTWIPDAAATSIDVLALRGTTLYVGGTNLGDIRGQACPGLCRLSTTASNVATAVDAAWQITPGFGGAIRTLAFSADAVYVGGRFGFNDGLIQRDALAKVSLTSAAVDTAWDPQPEPGSGPTDIRALQVVGSQVYIGGDFNRIDGQNIAGLARVSATGAGDVDGGWQPQPYAVNDIAVIGSDVYAVGRFTEVGPLSPVTRRYAAKFSTAAGAATAAWSPGFNNYVNEVVGTPGGNVLLGGEFTSAGPSNVERFSVARFDAGGRLDTTWNPMVHGKVSALATNGSSVFIGGDYPQIGREPISHIGKVSQSGAGAVDPAWKPTLLVPLGRPTALAANDTHVFIGQAQAANDTFSSDTLIKVAAGGAGAEDAAWNPNIDGGIRALLLSGNDLFVGGEFAASIATTTGPQFRTALAKLSASGTGLADGAWNPIPNARVWSIAKSGDDLFVGGEFTQLGIEPRTRVAKLKLTGDGQPDPDWAPPVNGTIRAVTVAGGQVYVGGDFTSTSGENIRRLARFSASGVGEIDVAFQPQPLLRVNTLLSTPTRVVVGGEFPALNGQDSQGLALYDIAAPTITFNLPGDGPGPAIAWLQGDTATVSFSCEDEGGVVASCVGTQVNGAPLDTSTIGLHTVTATAVDPSGNTTTKLATYVVAPRPPAPNEPGAGGGPAPTPPKDLIAPVLSKSGLAPKSFKAAKSGPSTVIPKPTKSKKKPKLKFGTRITLTLSEAATVKGTVIVPKKGKKKAKTVGSFTQALAAGNATFDFTGRVAGKKLKPGKYSLELVATDAAGNTSKVGKLSFTIKR